MLGSRTLFEHGYVSFRNPNLAFLVYLLKISLDREPRHQATRASCLPHTYLVLGVTDEHFMPWFTY